MSMVEQREGIAVRDFDMPFSRMVLILVKLALASIPAMIILWLIGGMLAGMAFAVLSALGTRPLSRPTRGLFISLLRALPRDPGCERILRV